MLPTIYHYHPITDEYLGAGLADASPLGDDWLIPAHATEAEPLAAAEREVVVFAVGGWAIQPDWRGVPLFSTNDGAPLTITEIGKTPTDIGATELPRPSPCHAWRDGAWVEDDELQAAELDRQRQALLGRVNAHADTLLYRLSASYPEREVSSWPQQVREAEALRADQNADAPLLSGIAAARGVPLAVLTEKVLTKASAYAAASGTIIGRRQALEDQLDAAKDSHDLDGIDILAGWPEVTT